jgi:hypothetical protein
LRTLSRLKLPLTAILTIFVVIDAAVGYRIWALGWPKQVRWANDQNGIAYLAVDRVPFTGLDWLILAVIAGGQLLLFYLVWKCWHVSRAHGQIRSSDSPPRP